MKKIFPMLNNALSRKFVMSALFGGLAMLPSTAHASALDAFNTWVSGLLTSASSVVTGLIGSVVSSVASSISSFFSGVSSFISGAVSGFFSWLSGSLGCGGMVNSGGGTVGDVICNVIDSSDSLGGMVSAVAYMMGMIMAVTALIKLKDHVESPTQHPISASLKRFVAGGALFMLPTVTEAAENMITGGVTFGGMGTGVSGKASGFGLDAMMVALMVDIFNPIGALLGAFGYLAGMVLTVIGISRLLKTAQDGPSGPAGVGTIMTFVLAGVLFTLNDLMGAFTGSLFEMNKMETSAVLMVPIDGGTVDDHVLSVISSILLFMMLVGWISFIRGFFILRDVAEGKGQASLMAAITHIFGGALAVNLGPFMNAVQYTLGLDSYGVLFS
ncbi:MAG: hypothetical protein RBR86_07390 [Pseudobdellovibrionaceae bacterium]|jgi:hypothetical protein|nr:hypothetical protein [Pseudobdellovibrionaceae bacterium]